METTTVRIDKADRDRLEALATNQNRPVEALLRDALNLLQRPQDSDSESPDQSGKLTADMVREDLAEILKTHYGRDRGNGSPIPDNEIHVSVEESDDGVLIRVKPTPETEIYTPERRAEFLLNNALDSDDYKEAVQEVRRMGLDPEKIPHEAPSEG